MEVLHKKNQKKDCLEKVNGNKINQPNCLILRI